MSFSVWGFMNSVLLIGHSTFTAGLQSQVRGLNTLTVTATTSAVAALPLIERLTPDIVIVQACVLTQKSVFKTFGPSPTAHTVVIETIGSNTHPTEAFLTHQFEQTAFALESGADAYLWLPFYPIEASPQGPGETPSPPGERAFPTDTQQSSLEHASVSRAAPSIQVAQLSPQKIDDGSLQRFSPSQCRLIQAHIQIGLGRAQRYRDLSRINDWLSAVALVDALTQLNNRRAFDLELPSQIQLTRAQNVPLSLMVLDIDYFKSVNDRFGHLVGDDILKQLAKRLLANMRFYDTPFRFGGEEFVITLNNTDAAEALTIANRLRKSIAQLPFTLTHPIKEVKEIPITVSIGLTELTPDDDEQGRALLDRADKNLLKAKGSGRNQVVSTP
ncbi:MAG: GGDEF domain-containing protein [Cyanobacteria bacterium J06560_2]